MDPDLRIYATEARLLLSEGKIAEFRDHLSARLQKNCTDLGLARLAVEYPDSVLLELLWKQNIFNPKEICELTGMTPLHYAVIYNDLKLVEEFGRLSMYTKDGPLQYHNNIDKSGRSPLHWAVLQDRQSELKELGWTKYFIRNIPYVHYTSQMIMLLCRDGQGANVNLLAGNGDQPLHSAIKTANWNAVSTLLVCMADVNASNVCGERPMHMAIKLYCPVHSGKYPATIFLKLIDSLCHFGASLTMLDSDGRSPNDYVTVKYVKDHMDRHSTMRSMIWRYSDVLSDSTSTEFELKCAVECKSMLNSILYEDVTRLQFLRFKRRRLANFIEPKTTTFSDEVKKWVQLYNAARKCYDTYPIYADTFMAHCFKVRACVINSKYAKFTETLSNILISVGYLPLEMIEKISEYFSIQDINFLSNSFYKFDALADEKRFKDFYEQFSTLKL